MGRLKALLIGLGAGATAMYYLDPACGKARRAACRRSVDRWLEDVTGSVAVLEQQVTDWLDGAPRGPASAARAVDSAAPATRDAQASAAVEGAAARPAPKEESWPPAAKAALELGGYALLGRWVLGRAFWPALIGGGGLYWAAKQGALERFAPKRWRAFSRSRGASLSRRVRALFAGEPERQVAEIMSADVAWCTADTALSEAARLMRDHDCGAIPVVDDGLLRRPIGVITDRDLALRAVAEGRDPNQVPVRECMSLPVATAHRAASLGQVTRIMEDTKLRRVVIVDDDGRLCGIVAQADLAREAPQADVGAVVREVSEPVSSSAG